VSPSELRDIAWLVGGGCHFLQPPLSALLARSVIPFQAALVSLDELPRRIFTAAMLFLTFLTVGLGLVVTVFHAELAHGSALARSLSGLLTLLWGGRGVVQHFYYWRSGVWPRDRRGARWNRLLLAIFAVQTTSFALATALRD
jgi:hypothetical protein